MKYFVAVMLSLMPSMVCAETFSHNRWDAVLQEFVDDSGFVDYAGLKANPSELQAYVTELAQESPDNAPGRFLSMDDELAYWINAYNALTLKNVIRYYPIKSVRDAKSLYGFFLRDTHVVGGKKMTLNTIEHKIIRKRFKEPRIHFAVNCASIGCPRLERGAFRAETLDADLDRLTREFVDSAKHVRVEGDTLWVSKILDWYGKDFGDVSTYLARYATPEKAKQMKNKSLRFIEYDWSLNERRR